MSDSRYLPAGFPMPDPEAMARLRENVMKGTRTPHPPEKAELAALIAADEAGIDLGGIDAEALWAEPPEARAAVFGLLRDLLAELAGA